MTDAAGLSIEEYRALLDKVFDEQVVGWTAEAEASERLAAAMKPDHDGYTELIGRGNA